MYISTKVEGSFPSQMDETRDKVDKSESKFGCFGPVSYLDKLNDFRWFKHTFFPLTQIREGVCKFSGGGGQ